MSLRRKYFILLIFIILFTPLAVSDISIPAKPPSFSLDTKDDSSIKLEINRENQPHDTRKISMYPLLITKSIDINHFECVPNNTICVLVEVECINLEDYKADTPYINIEEYIDPGLEVVSYSRCYILHSITEIRNCKKGLYKKYDLNSSSKKDILGIATIDIKSENNTLFFSIKDGLKRKDHAVYWYYVRPTKPGNFNTETFIRIWDKKYQDLVIPLEIESIPKFDIKLVVEKLDASFDTPISLTYDITYSGIGAISNPYYCNIELDQSNDYDFTNGCDYKFDNLSFDLYGTGSVNSSIIIYNPNFRYKILPYHSIYSLPGIKINGQHYTIDETITVENWASRYLTYIISSLAILIAFWEFGSTKKDIHKLTEYLTDSPGDASTTKKPRLIREIIQKFKKN